MAISLAPMNRFPPNLGCGCFSSCSNKAWYLKCWNAKKKKKKKKKEEVFLWCHRFCTLRHIFSRLHFFLTNWERLHFSFGESWNVGIKTTHWQSHVNVLSTCSSATLYQCVHTQIPPTSYIGLIWHTIPLTLMQVGVPLRMHGSYCDSSCHASSTVLQLALHLLWQEYCPFRVLLTTSTETKWSSL